MSTQRLTQLLHPNRKHLNELTLDVLWEDKETKRARKIDREP